MQGFSVALIHVLLIITSSCNRGYYQQENLHTSLDTIKFPDYSNLSYWAAHPHKEDPSDSIPVPLKGRYRYDSSVDVFFVHPTTFTSRSSTQWNADLNDAFINSKTDNSTILFQASVFNQYRVFAPRYRQAHIRAYYTTDTVAAEAFDTAYLDIRNAFLHYMTAFNNGRPVIIASHSQGSTHSQRLLKEFFDGQPLQKQLVAAYVIGMRIDGEQYEELEMCTDSTQTGCLIGWRTYRQGYTPEFVAYETGKPMVTNPLTWTTTEIPAPRKLNKGAILRDFRKLAPAVADAKISGRVLWVSELKFPGSIFINTKNLHVGDINLFYLNIRENLRTRVDSYRDSVTD